MHWEERLGEGAAWMRVVRIGCRVGKTGYVRMQGG